MCYIGMDRICPPHVCVIQKIPCGIGLGITLYNVCSVPYIAIFNISLDSSAIYLLASVGMELPLCVVVTLS